MRLAMAGYWAGCGLFLLMSAGASADPGATVRETHLPEGASRVETDEPSFSLDQYRWQKRVLVVSAPGQDDTQLRDQVDAVSAARGPFEERDMVLVILLRDGASTAGARLLSSEDVAEARNRLGMSLDSFSLRLIGKDGGIKLTSDDPVPMAEIFALIDTMPMRLREMEER